MTKRRSPTGPDQPHTRPRTRPSSEKLPEPKPAPLLRGKPIRPPGPWGCRRYMRQRLAAALPSISDKLLQDACGGKLAALKLVVHISGLDDKDSHEMSSRFSAGRTYEDLLREQWQKEPVYVYPSVHPFPLEFHPPENPDELVGPMPGQPAPLDTGTEIGPRVVEPAPPASPAAQPPEAV